MRLVTSGAEFKAATTVVGQAESEGYLCGGSPTIETTVVRSGAAAWKATANGQYAGFNQTTVDANNYFARGYFRLPSTPSAETYLISVQPSATGSVRMLAGTTTVALFDNNDAQVGSASGSLALDTWHRIELVIGKTATLLQLYVNGVQVASTSSAALAGTFTQFRFGHIGATASTDVVYWDDIAINDSTGGVDDGLPGPGKVILLLAASDQQRDTGWLEGDAGTGALYDEVNNTPPTANAGASTNYIVNAVSTTTETYTAETTTYSAGGITATDRIKVVRPVAVIGDAVGAATRSIGLELTLNPVAAEVTANTGTGAVGTYPFGWNTVRGTLVSSPSVTLTDPIRVRVRKNSANADNLAVALLGVYVEYAPPVSLDGTSAGTSTTSGSLGVALPLSGTSAGASTTSGSIEVVRSLDGGSAGASTTSGSVVLTAALDGTSAGTSTTSGTPDLALALSGTSTGSGVTSGDLVRLIVLDGTSAGLSTTTGAVEIVFGLAGTSTGVSTTSGDAVVAYVLDGTSTGSSTTVGDLEGAAPTPTPTFGGAVWVRPPKPRKRLVALTGISRGTSTTYGVLTVTRDPRLQREEELVLALL